MTWQRQPVEKRILPLVQALNWPGLVWTLASCEGHPSRGTGPYVFFACATGLASRISMLLWRLYRDNELTYYWEITGVFDPENGQLAFSLHAPLLDRMSLQTEIRLRISRSRLNTDLGLLAEKIEKLVGLAGDDKGCNGGENDDEAHYSAMRPLPRLFPEGVCAAAARAALSVRGNGTSTNDAAGQSGHGLLQRGLGGNPNLPHFCQREEAS